MKKHAILVVSGLLLSICMLFTGCGEGEGAEDTGDDGKVANGSRTTVSTTHSTDTRGDNDTGTTTGDMAGGMMNDDSMIP